MSKLIAIARREKIGATPVTGAECPDWREQYLSIVDGQAEFAVWLISDDGTIKPRRCRFPVSMPGEIVRQAAADIMDALKTCEDYKSSGIHIKNIRQIWVKRWYDGKIFTA